ncbi:MAG: YnbE family lipoprotein [Pseudomonadota bacterium]
MNVLKLTRAKAAVIHSAQAEKGEFMPRSTRLSKGPFMAGALMVSATALSGCINVAAPEEPIVIELNINIRQEVIYRLAEDAADTIEENSDIF